MGVATWFYRGGRPNLAARIIDRGTAVLYGFGIAPDHLVRLEVPGRRTGRPIARPLVMVVVEGERYLVSMLGPEADWVRNVRAAGGAVALHHGRREPVRLEEVPPEHRAPVLRAYLKRAPNARAHFPVGHDASAAGIAAVAPGYPVFRVRT